MQAFEPQLMPELVITQHTIKRGTQRVCIPVRNQFEPGFSNRETSLRSCVADDGQSACDSSNCATAHCGYRPTYKELDIGARQNLGYIPGWNYSCNRHNNIGTLQRALQQISSLKRISPKGNQLKVGLVLASVAKCFGNILNFAV